MWPDVLETQQLLDQARQGDAGAVDRLLARHREPLRRAIDLRLDHALARRVDASDIVQEAMLEANRRLNHYLKDPLLPFHLWLRNIALDRVIDAHRRHRQAQRRSVDREQSLPREALYDQSSFATAAALVDPALTPATAALRQELERRSQEALARLGADDREVILMRHFEQLSNREVAAALGLSEPAAGMRYLRALRRLRGLLLPPE